MPEMKFDYVNVAIVTLIATGIFFGGLYVKNNILVSTVDGIPEAEIYRGNLAVKTSENDFVSGGAHTSSNAKIYWYSTEPTSESDGIVISSTAKTVEVMDGWGWVSVHNEDDGYLIAPWLESEFRNQNPRIKEIYYKDLDSDDKKELVAKVWFGDLKVGAEDPEWTFNINWIDEDVTLSDDNPSDITGQGTTSGTAFTITWKLSGLTAGDGCVFGKIYFATNDTREGNDIRLEDLRLYGDWTIKGKTSWSTPVSVSSGNYEAIYFSPIEYTDPFNGILCYRKPQASDALYVSLQGKTYLEAGNNITVDLFIEIIGGDGATTQLNDQVMISA